VLKPGDREASTPEDELREVELRRLRALVQASEAELEALHSPEFLLVNPSGTVWSRAFYLGGVVAGTIDYRRFDADSFIEVVIDGNLGIVRYRSAIDIQVLEQQGGPLKCWHMDCYQRSSPDAPWQVIWSQATESADAPD